MFDIRSNHSSPASSQQLVHFFDDVSIVWILINVDVFVWIGHVVVQFLASDIRPIRFAQSVVEAHPLRVPVITKNAMFEVLIFIQ